MDAFELELMRRSPLAAAVLEISDFVFSDEFLDSLYDRYRGRCYQDVLGFSQFLCLMRDALTHHGGSAHQLFLDLERKEKQPVDESNFYRKLARMPVQVSRALLREGTQRLGQLQPCNLVKLPDCFDGFTVVAGDGKKIKKAAGRLKPTRGYSGGLLGAKALVALNLRNGLAIAMSDSLDGLTNDVPLVPELMQQLYQVIAGPLLSVWDRQFEDIRTFGHLAQRPGDAFVVRMRKGDAIYTVESCVESRDEQGRRVLDEIVVLSRGKNKPKEAMRLRRVTLVRQGEEDIVLVSNLLDRHKYSAADLLSLYRFRWNIEQVFQQVTETFSLEHLIGCMPRAVLMQFAFCLLLYNLVQVIKAYLAEDGGVLATVVSTFYLFNDMRRELTAWAYHTSGVWPHMHRDASAMRKRLSELMRGVWNPIAYTKAADKKPRGKPKTKIQLHGGHSSVQRLLEGRARVIAK